MTLKTTKEQRDDFRNGGILFNDASVGWISDLCHDADRAREFQVEIPGLKELLDAVKAIRASDCGAWQKDCMGGLFKCSEGRAKRMELGRLLDQLYKVVGI